MKTLKFSFSETIMPRAMIFDNIYYEGNLSEMPGFDVFFSFGM